MGRLRIFKPGDWYTNPQRTYEGKFLWRVSKYEIRTSWNNRSKYVSLEFDCIIDIKGNLKTLIRAQSNRDIDKEMVRVPKKIMKIILEKQPGYLNLLNLLL